MSETKFYTETSRRLVLKGGAGKYRVRAIINLRKFGDREVWELQSVEVKGKRETGFGYLQRGEMKLKNMEQVKSLTDVLQQVVDVIDSDEVEG